MIYSQDYSQNEENIALIIKNFTGMSISTTLGLFQLSIFAFSVLEVCLINYFFSFSFFGSGDLIFWYMDHVYARQVSYQLSHLFSFLLNVLFHFN